ncbi:hypothetical protein TNCT_728601 [Trichonephila clavata]|uniref:Uncharacterized protein n=1 Tax=Trichonephila clavata TaxID=2740835 RepID=A0A8X6JA72_TRICU|nr:hypothetical protein TNCT_728601 [Trichonephila clavata]
MIFDLYATFPAPCMYQLRHHKSLFPEKLGHVIRRRNSEFISAESQNVHKHSNVSHPAMKCEAVYKLKSTVEEQVAMSGIPGDIM